MVVAAISQEVGAAFAVGLFAALGAIGAAFVRLFVAGVILCVALRPRLRGLSGRAWFSAVALAATVTVMNAQQKTSKVESVFTLSYEIDGEPRPACVADVIVLYP